MTGCNEKNTESCLWYSYKKKHINWCFHKETWDKKKKPACNLEALRSRTDWGFQMKADQRNMTINCNAWFWTRPFCWKGHHEDNRWKLKEVRELHGGNTSTSSAWFWWSYCGYTEERPFCGEYKLKLFRIVKQLTLKRIQAKKFLDSCSLSVGLKLL